MKTQGVVKTIRENGIAVVACARESACDGCHKQAEGGCSVCSFMSAGKTMEIEVENSLGAAVGDCVEIESATGRILLYGALTFFAPIVISLLLYFLVNKIVAKQGIALACAGAGFALYFLLLRLFSEHVLGSNKGRDVFMTRFVCRKEGKQ